MFTIPHYFSGPCTEKIKQAEDCLDLTVKEGGCHAIEALSKSLAFKGCYYDVSWINECSSDDFLSNLPWFVFDQVMHYLPPQDRLATARSSKFLYQRICGEEGKSVWQEGCIVSVWNTWKLIQKIQEQYKLPDIREIKVLHIRKLKALSMVCPIDLLFLFGTRPYQCTRDLRKIPAHLPELAEELLIAKNKNDAVALHGDIYQFGLPEKCLIPFCNFYNNLSQEEKNRHLQPSVFVRLKKDHPYFDFKSYIKGED